MQGQTNSFLQRFAKYFKSLKMGKLLLISSVVLLVISCGWFVFRYVIEKTSSIRDVTVTNVTDTSATVSWVTESPVRGSIIYGKEDSWFPVFKYIGKTRAYDDRDIEEVEYGVYKLDEWGEYYVHHVTLRGLEPNSKYYYKVGTGFKSVEYEYPVLETAGISDELNMPFPVYGRAYDDKEEQYGDVLVYLHLERDEDSSQVLSTVTNESGGWSIDIGNIRKEDLAENFPQDYFKVSIDVYFRNGKEEERVFTQKNLQPVDDIILISSEENQESSIKGSERSGSLGEKLVGSVQAQCDNMEWFCNGECADPVNVRPHFEAYWCAPAAQWRYQKANNSGACGGYASTPKPNCGGQTSPPPSTPTPPSGRVCSPEVWRCNATKDCADDRDAAAFNAVWCKPETRWRYESANNHGLADDACGGYKTEEKKPNCGGQQPTPTPPRKECYPEVWRCQNDCATPSDAANFEAYWCYPEQQWKLESARAQNLPDNYCGGTQSIRKDDPNCGHQPTPPPQEPTPDPNEACRAGSVAALIGSTTSSLPFRDFIENVYAQTSSCEGRAAGKIWIEYAQGGQIRCREFSGPGDVCNGCWDDFMRESENLTKEVRGWRCSICQNGVWFKPEESCGSTTITLPKDQTGADFDVIFNIAGGTQVGQTQRVAGYIEGRGFSRTCTFMCEVDGNWYKTAAPCDPPFPYETTPPPTPTEPEGTITASPTLLNFGSYEFGASCPNGCLQRVKITNGSVNRIAIIHGGVTPSLPFEVISYGGINPNTTSYFDVKLHTGVVSGEYEDMSGFEPKTGCVVGDACYKEVEIDFMNNNGDYVGTVKLNLSVTITSGAALPVRPVEECPQGESCSAGGYWSCLRDYDSEGTCFIMEGDMIGCQVDVERLEGDGLCKKSAPNNECVCTKIWHTCADVPEEVKNAGKCKCCDEERKYCYTGTYPFSDVLATHWREDIEAKTFDVTVVVEDTTAPGEGKFVVGEEIITRGTDPDGYTVLCDLKCTDENKWSIGGCEYPAAETKDFDRGLVSRVAAEEDITDVITVDPGVYEVSSDTYNLMTGQIETVNGEFRLFTDENKNGVKDEGEEYITGFEKDAIKLKKVADIEGYNLKQGWNLISFPMVLEEAKTAKAFLTEIAVNGGYATHVATYRSGKWAIYSQRGDVSFSDDFNILPGVGYFVKVHEGTRLNLKGNRFEESLPLNLEVGWNLVGVISPGKDYTAESFIDVAVNAGITADTVTKWESGKYENFIKEKGMAYGNDFKIFDVGGYFVRVKEKGGRFTP